jgi:hypothetical protein
MKRGHIVSRGTWEPQAPTFFLQFNLLQMRPDRSSRVCCQWLHVHYNNNVWNATASPLPTPFFSVSFLLLAGYIFLCHSLHGTRRIGIRLLPAVRGWRCAVHYYIVSTIISIFSFCIIDCDLVIMYECRVIIICDTLTLRLLIKYLRAFQTEENPTFNVTKMFVRSPRRNVNNNKFFRLPRLSMKGEKPRDGSSGKLSSSRCKLGFGTPIISIERIGSFIIAWKLALLPLLPTYVGILDGAVM